MNSRFNKDINYSILCISNARQYIEDGLYCLNDAESYLGCSDSQKRSEYIEELRSIYIAIESISTSLGKLMMELDND